jgi:hypothetical protein
MHGYALLSDLCVVGLKAVGRSVFSLFHSTLLAFAWNSCVKPQNAWLGYPLKDSDRIHNRRIVTTLTWVLVGYVRITCLLHITATYVCHLSFSLCV